MSAEIDHDARGLTISWSAGAACGEIKALCILADGSRHTGAEWSPSGAGFRASAGPVDVSIVPTTEGEVVRLALAATGTAAAEVVAIGITCRPEVGGGSPDWWVYNGYQSWDPADVVSTTGISHRSWWTAAIASNAGDSIALASETAERLATWFELKEGSLDALEGAPTGAPPVAWVAKVGEVLELEPINLSAGKGVWTGLHEVAGGRPRVARVPIGWLSWYHYGPWISEDDVLENSAVLRHGSLEGLGYAVVQIDDGWQQAYGDWKTNTKFGRGLERITERLGEAGQVAGVWTAPFLVSASADLSTDAPEDWFVQDPGTGGRLVDPVHLSFGPMHVLDASRPPVLDHLEKVFAGLYAAGIRYYKIDFLYAGAYAGVPALRAGIAAIRKAVRDSYILACGAPLQPLAGMVEGCRIGQDTATPIYDFDSGQPRARMFGDELLWISRNVAFRNHLAGWFQLDPDVALVGANLSVGEARQLVTAVALCGGPFFASDALLSLEPDRLGLLTNPELLALVGGPPAVPDWEPGSAGRPPAIWRRGDEVLAAFNWKGPSRSLVVEVEGDGRVRDLWSRSDLTLREGRLTIPLEEAGVAVLKFEGGGRLAAWLE